MGDAMREMRRDGLVRNRPGAPHPWRGGFTLVELLIVLIVFGLVSAAATRFLLRQSESLARGSEVTNVRQNTRAALHRLSSDIRLVGQGLNFYDLEVPDLIVPNDGSVAVSSYTDSTISLISIPDPSDPAKQLFLDPGVPNNGDAGSASVQLAAGSDLSGLGSGARAILFDPNTGNSQVVTLTGVVGLTLQFARDTLVFSFPPIGATPAKVLKLNEVRFRVNSQGPIPFLERKVNDGPWIRYIEGIDRIRFTYFDSIGSVLQPTTQAQRRAIRRVGISVRGVSLRLTRGTDKRSRLTLQSDVVPRNMLPAP